MLDSSRLRLAVVIGAYNLIQNRLVPSSGYVPANLAVTTGLVFFARAQGCSKEALGFDPSQLSRGKRLSTAGAGLSMAVAMIVAAHPATRRFLLDERAANQRNGDVAYQVLVRFPIGTALFEEVAFRGVIPAVWRRSGASDAQATLAGAVAFGAWHLIPGSDVLGGNPMTSQLGTSTSRVAAVAGGATAAGLAGLGLSWMRERSGGLLAPWVTHAALNGALYLAAVAAWRRSNREKPLP